MLIFHIINAQKRKYACKICRQLGHNKANCASRTTTTMATHSQDNVDIDDKDLDDDNIEDDPEYEGMVPTDVLGENYLHSRDLQRDEDGELTVEDDSNYKPELNWVHVSDVTEKDGTPTLRSGISHHRDSVLPDFKNNLSRRGPARGTISSSVPESISTAEDFWELVLNNDIVLMLVNGTNSYAVSVQEKNWRDTNIYEMRYY